MCMKPLFDRVVVVDPVALSGLAFCALIDSMRIATPAVEWAPDHRSVYQKLARNDGGMTLLITGLTSPRDSLADGLAMLDGLQPLQDAGRLRVMVCTGLDDPLMLEVIAGHRPASICLRRESLDMLCRTLWMTGRAPDVRQVYCSPGVSLQLTQALRLRVPPRVLAWLVTQVDGLSLAESAQVMAVQAKTAWAWRLRLTRLSGGKNKFAGYLARLRGSIITPEAACRITPAPGRAAESGLPDGPVHEVALYPGD